MLTDCFSEDYTYVLVIVYGMLKYSCSIMMGMRAFIWH